MRPGKLNLLNHPRKALLPWRRYLLWGVPSFVGMLLLGGWIQAQHSELQQQHRHWTEQLALQDKRLNQQRAQREQQQAQAQAQAIWQGIKVRQQRLLAVQELLQQEAEQGMRLMRWQADGQRQWLQGHWPQARGLTAFQERLSQALGQTWTLQSLNGGQTAGAVGWTLEAPWPAALASGAAP